RLPALYAFFIVLPFGVDALVQLRVIPSRLRFPPLLFAAVVLGAATPLCLLRPISNDIAPFAITMLVGEMGSRLRRPLSALIALLPSIAVAVLAIQYRAPGFTVWILAFAFAWMAGSWMQAQTVLATQLREAQAGLAERAATEERSRIAREVHDVLAHSMT